MASNQSEAEQCLIPELDKLTPFSFPPDDTRPPTVRLLGTTLQIISIDESIPLYVVEIDPAPQGVTGAAYINYKRTITPQMEAAITKCRGTISNP